MTWRKRYVSTWLGMLGIKTICASSKTADLHVLTLSILQTLITVSCHFLLCTLARKAQTQVYARTSNLVPKAHGTLIHLNVGTRFMRQFMHKEKSPYFGGETDSM